MIVSRRKMVRIMQYDPYVCVVYTKGDRFF